METRPAIEGLQEQRNLVEALEAQGGWNIIVGDRGMRDIGYKCPSHAVLDIIDNALDASAQHGDTFGFEAGQNKSPAKP